jgi:hypothetical protein
MRDGSISTTRPVRPDPAASGLTSALSADFKPPWWMHGFPGWQHPDSFPEAPILPSRRAREIDCRRKTALLARRDATRRVSHDDRE